MWQRFTERARRVIFSAQEEAANWNSKFVGVEHIVLGLTVDSSNVACRIMDELGLSIDGLRAALEGKLSPGPDAVEDDLQLSPNAKRVIDLAFDEARLANCSHIGTEHLLLGVIRVEDRLVTDVLENQGVNLDRTRTCVAAHQGEYSPPPMRASQFPGVLRIAGNQAAELLAQASVGKNPGGKAEALGLLRRAVELIPAEANAGAGIQNSRQEAKLAAGALLKVAREFFTELKHFRTVGDISIDQAWMLLCLARALKITIKADPTAHAVLFPCRKLAMIFEKPSLRTRVSFEAGMVDFGGHAIYLQPSDISLGKRESVADVARNLSRLASGIMARVFSHDTIQELAKYATVPVINGLCDREHPCQAVTDYQTIWEQRGAIEGQKVVYVGDGNNTAHSLMLLGAKLGAHVVIACPPGYEPLADVLAASQQDAAVTGGSVTVTHDPQEACRDADVIYTDVWASMGQEDEAAERAQVFAPYQVNEALVALAKPDYTFLHCLPAHRGEEVTEAVLESPNSKVFDQAENRLHAQKAILAVLLS